MNVEATATSLVVVSESEADTEALGQALAGVIAPSTVIGLVGPLGAGKTRLTRAIAEGLGASSQAISSPTFVLIQEYEATLPVYHFDVYRLRSPGEFEALGPDEYFEGEGVCLVEWADRVADFMPRTTWWITAEPRGEQRVFTLALDQPYRTLVHKALDARLSN